MGVYLDLTYKKFGKWTVLENDGKSVAGNIKWLCICECGTGRSVVEGSLVGGYSKSCGKCNRINEIGNVYGQLTVISQVKIDRWGNVFWRCNCECGGKKIINGNSLRRGITKNCGCNGLTHI